MAPTCPVGAAGRGAVSPPRRLGPSPSGRGRRGPPRRASRRRGRVPRQFAWRSRHAAGSMVYSDGDRRHVLRGPPRPLGASLRRAPHAAVALLPRHAGPCCHAERVRRGDAGGQGPRDRRRGGPAGPGRRPRPVPLDRPAAPRRRRKPGGETLILIALLGGGAPPILPSLRVILP